MSIVRPPRRGNTLLGRRWHEYLSRFLNQYGVSEPAIIMLTALLVGIGAGLGAVVFRRLIEGV
jgi:hypothetical protein